MTCLEQLEQWVVGNSIHNTERDECCPDFSCCNKNITTSEEERRAFLEAYKQGNTESTNTMLMMFLCRSLSAQFPNNAFIARVV